MERYGIPGMIHNKASFSRHGTEWQPATGMVMAYQAKSIPVYCPQGTKGDGGPFDES